MTVYDDCYESGERARNAQYRWQREKEEEEEEETGAIGADRRARGNDCRE